MLSHTITFQNIISCKLVQEIHNKTDIYIFIINVQMECKILQKDAEVSIFLNN